MKPSSAPTALPDATDRPATEAVAPGAQDGSELEASSGSALREELVRQAAYRRWLERGKQDGNDLQDWLDAEAEIDQSPAIE